MAQKLEEAKNSLEKMKKKEIEINAKLSILQNYQLSLELEHFSHKINQLLKENRKLQEEIDKQIRDIDIQKSSQVDYSEKENCKKRQLLALNNKNQELEDKIADLEVELQDLQNGGIIRSTRDVLSISR